MKDAFTLLELLVAITVIAVLAAIAIPTATGVTRYAARVKSVSNLRQIGVAARLFANDHDQQIPVSPAEGGLLDPLLSPQPTVDRWPRLLCSYLTPSDPRVFLDPLDTKSARLPLTEVLSNDKNNTGFVYNGFDDLFTDGAERPVLLRLTRFEEPGKVLLMSQKAPDKTDFYVNLLSKPLDLLGALLNPAVFDGGAHYLYLDGRVEFLKKAEYNNKLWLTDKTLDIPLLPPLFGRGSFCVTEPQGADGPHGRRGTEH